MRPRSVVLLCLLLAFGALCARADDSDGTGSGDVEEAGSSAAQEEKNEVLDDIGEQKEVNEPDKVSPGNSEDGQKTVEEQNSDEQQQEKKEGNEERGEEEDEDASSEDVNDTIENLKEKFEEDKDDDPIISRDAPVIETTEGKVRGSIMKSRNGKLIYMYQGIPYAKPPVGDLRFKPPQRAEKWEDVRDATRERSECPQNKFPTRQYVGNEDCLYLNVYTTRLPVNDSVVGKVVWDVVVLIHGGGFTHGSGHFDDYSPEHLLDADMVLVTFNYRLGPLGFLATGDEASAGNYGLKDQVDALRWVRRNIESFSGNPKSVTLLGVHAGAASAHFHMLSPLSEDLFHGVISISGTGLSPWAHVPAQEAQRRAFRLGELVGCKSKGKEKEKDTKDLIKCLKRKRTEDLIKQTPHVTEWLHDMHYPFVPVTEPLVKGKKAFLHDDPETMIKELKNRKVFIPWIIGVSSHEGLPQALQTMVFRATLNQLNENPIKYLPLYLEMSIEPQSKAEEIAKRAWDFYIGNDSLNYGNLVQLAEITSDYNYFYGVVKSIDLHSQVSESPLFVYHFSFHIRDPRFTLGVPQGDDVRYLFPDRIAGKKVEYEKEVFPTVDRLVKLVSNFAMEGDPTPEEIELLNNVQWPVADGKNFEYINIGDNITVVSDGFYTKRMEFWNTIYEDLAEKQNIKDEL